MNRQKYLNLLKANQDKINWSYLSLNPAAIHLLEKMLEENPDKIRWEKLSGNPNPAAIKILEAKPEKIEWCYLSGNPAAIRLLKTNPDKINYKQLGYYNY
jgi:hypothetical protein